MPRKPGESHLQFRKRVLDPISPTFCAAKWLNSSISLNSGKSASCCISPAYKISPELVAKDPWLLHNTHEKMESRNDLLLGVQAKDCRACWDVENINPGMISDRTYRSTLYTDDDISKILEPSERKNPVPRYLEIAFDNNCQFACLYCNPNTSSRWEAEINKFGPISSDLENKAFSHYSIDTTSNKEGPNPYIDAFWLWFPKIKDELRILRITGGEPLISPHVWKLIETISNQPNPKFQLQLNSNLGFPPITILKLLEQLSVGRPTKIYTSCDSYGARAEYLRTGLNWKQWSTNIELLASSPKIDCVSVIITITNLSIFNQVELLEHLHSLKKKIGRTKISFSMNYLKDPAFFRWELVPIEIRSKAAEEAEEWLELRRSEGLLTEFEISNLRTAIEVLRKQGKNLDVEKEKKKLIFFLDEIDRRRNRNYRDFLDEKCQSWLAQQ